jgi:hypothetical protein
MGNKKFTILADNAPLNITFLLFIKIKMKYYIVSAKFYFDWCYIVQVLW